MNEKSIMYSLTFLGLYLELGGAFLLSAEAIGLDHLHKIADMLRKHRIISFAAFVLIIIGMIILSKLHQILHLFELLILAISLGLTYDFAPRFIGILVKRQEKGTLGMIGFLLFSLGFAIQAYVNLSLLY